MAHGGGVVHSNDRVLRLPRTSTVKKKKGKEAALLGPTNRTPPHSLFTTEQDLHPFRRREALQPQKDPVGVAAAENADAAIERKHLGELLRGQTKKIKNKKRADGTCNYDRSEVSGSGVSLKAVV